MGHGHVDLVPAAQLENAHYVACVEEEAVTVVPAARVCRLQQLLPTPIRDGDAVAVDQMAQQTRGIGPDGGIVHIDLEVDLAVDEVQSAVFHHEAVGVEVEAVHEGERAVGQP